MNGNVFFTIQEMPQPITFIRSILPLKGSLSVTSTICFTPSKSKIQLFIPKLFLITKVTLRNHNTPSINSRQENYLGCSVLLLL